MGWGGNFHPTFDIPTVISDNSDKVREGINEEKNLDEEMNVLSCTHRIVCKLVRTTTTSWTSASEMTR